MSGMGIFVLEEAATGAFAFGAESDWAYAGMKPKIAGSKTTRKLARPLKVVFLTEFLPLTLVTTPLNGRGVE
jgi:hypothetical protein